MDKYDKNLYRQFMANLGVEEDIYPSPEIVSYLTQKWGMSKQAARLACAFLSATGRGIPLDKIKEQIAIGKRVKIPKKQCA